MFKIQIKDQNNLVTNEAKFSTEELANTWYNQNLISFPVSHTKVITNVASEEQALQESIDALKYLTETDLYVVRKAETNIDYPQEIKDLRAAARLKVL